MASATQFYSFKPLDKKGQPFDFSTLNGKVVLIVNTASKCGFTPQFDGLEILYKQLKKEHGGTHSLVTFPSRSFGPSNWQNTDAFEIVGFPCNQFGSQDPGSNDDIQTFCRINYGVTFPVLGKVDVNGDGADPVWQWLKKEKPGLMGLQRVKWNFEKFLVNKDGKVIGRWASTTKPEALKAPIEAEIAKVRAKA
jgi:glutathione peroxidase-family protein